MLLDEYFRYFNVRVKVVFPLPNEFLYVPRVIAAFGA